MNVADLLIDQFDRLPDLVEGAVDGLSAEQLTWAPAPGANTIGWLVWHLARVQDDHIAEVLGAEQIWVTGDWGRRFGLGKTDAGNNGYGHSPQEVAAVRPESAEALVDYYTAVAARTREFVEGLGEDDLDRIVDERWSPPVTLGVRLVSIVGDDLQHVGQAAYLRGLLP